MKKYLIFLLSLSIILSLSPVMANDTFISNYTSSSGFLNNSDTPFVDEIDIETYSDENYQNLDADCCSIVVHVNEGKYVYAHRRDSTYAADLYIVKTKIGDKDTIKEYKTYNGYFYHTIVTKDGWFSGAGGPDIVSVNKALESLTSEMVSNNKITTVDMNRANSLVRSLSLGHYVIKSPSGDVGIIIKNGGSSKYSIFKMKDGEYISVPNSPSYYRKGSYKSFSNDPIDAAIKIAGTDRWGVNRRNILTFAVDYNYKTDLVKIEKFNSKLNKITVSDKFTPLIVSKDQTVKHLNGDYFKITLKDDNGNLISNVPVDLTVMAKYWNKTYTVKTDENGLAKLQINLNIGDYNIKSFFKGNNDYLTMSKTNSVKVRSKYTPIISAKDLFAKYGEKNYFTTVLKGNELIFNETIGLTVLAKTWNKTYPVKTDEKGIAKLAINLAPGDYKIKSYFKGNENYSSANAINDIKISRKHIAKLSTNDLVKDFTETKMFVSKLTSQNNTPLINKAVCMNVFAKTWNKTYTINTNNYGYSNLNIQLAPGVYTIKSVFNTDNVYDSVTNINKVTVLKEYAPEIFSSDFTQKNGQGKSFEVLLKDKNYNVSISNRLVNLTIIANSWNKTYSVRTNADGIAKLPINLNIGSYKVNASIFEGITTKTYNSFKDYSISMYATRDTGKLLGRSPKAGSDNIYYLSKKISGSSIPVIPNKLLIGQVVFK